MITQRDVCRKYRSENKDMSTLKLARIVYNDNKLLFKDVESARSTLRDIEGKHGRAASKIDQEAGFVRTEERPRNPYNIPESDETVYEPYKLKCKRLLILSDIHIPYHSISALTAAFDYAKKEKPDCVLLNGDTIDHFALSKFAKDPKKRHFAEELNTFKEFFPIIQKVFKDAKIVFKVGNHEERYEHFLWQKAKELEGVNEFKFENIIKARANGIDFVGGKRIIHANKLNIIHGHEFASGFFSPVNVARGLALRAKASAIQGHNHQSSEHTQVDINGKVMTTFSVGALCELHPEYAPINNWNHGFCLVDLADNGEDFEVRNKRIYKGKVL
jgi:predicted phosphodiesterase